MGFFSKLILLAVVLLVAAAFYMGWRYNFEWRAANEISIQVSQEEIQRIVEPEFPIQRDRLGFTVTISNPKVSLVEGSDRIGLTGDSRIGVLGLTALNGQFSILSRAQIVVDKMILHDFTLQDLTIPGLKPEHKAKALDVLNTLLNERLNARPVALDLSDRIKNRIGQYNIKRMAAKNGRMEIVIQPIRTDTPASAPQPETREGELR